MSRVSIATCESAPIITPPFLCNGSVVTRALFSGDHHPIHLEVYRLEPGAAVQFSGDPTDVAIFVWKGTAAAGGARLERGSSVIVEFGAALNIAAPDEGATLVAFTLAKRHAGSSGMHVHLLPNERVPRTDQLGGTEGVSGAIHADSQCPTCAVWMHENGYAAAGKETPVHSHSENEIIFVTAGSMRIGRREYGPGSALAIAANTKYGFFSGQDGLSFVNFRGSSPTYRSGDGSVTMDEAELWRSLLGRPVYLEPVR